MIYIDKRDADLDVRNSHRTGFWSGYGAGFFTCAFIVCMAMYYIGSNY